MSSTANAAPIDAATRATRHAHFELALTLTLFTWPVLSLAVQNGWGGPSSAQKREWFAGAISELFPSPTSPTTPLPDLSDVEERLLQIMEDEFEVVVDDDSSLEVATGIMGFWRSCVEEGEFGGVERLRAEFERRGGANGGVGVESIRAAVLEGGDDDSVDEEEEWSGLSDDDEDEEMEDAPPQLASVREKVAPEVDDEGFTKVVGKRKGR